MASRIVILPGKNPVLQRIVQHLADFDDVHVFDSASDALWHTRQHPPQVVVADIKLEDMTAAEFVEILPNLAPATRLILSGAHNPEIDRAIQGTKVEVLSPGDNVDHSVWAIYQALGIAPPAPRTATGSLKPATPAPADPAAAVLQPAPPAPAPPAAPAVSPAVPVAVSVARVVANPLPQGPLPVAITEALVDVGAVSNGTGTPAARPIPPAITNAAGRSGVGVVPKPSTPTPRPAPPARAETPPVPAPTPATAVRGGGPLIIRPQQETSIRALLKTLADDSGAQAVMLSDTAGMVLMEVGALQRIMTHMLGMLLATNFSTAAELARQLGEQEASALYFHEGSNYDIYAFNVGFRFILTLTFDKQMGASKLGPVWVYAKRVTRQLQQILGS